MACCCLYYSNLLTLSIEYTTKLICWTLGTETKGWEWCGQAELNVTYMTYSLNDNCQSASVHEDKTRCRPSNVKVNEHHDTAFWWYIHTNLYSAKIVRTKLRRWKEFEANYSQLIDKYYREVVYYWGLQCVIKTKQAIDDKLQGSVATWRCGRVLNHIKKCLLLSPWVENFLESVNIWQSYKQERDCFLHLPSFSSALAKCTRKSLSCL